MSQEQEIEQEIDAEYLRMREEVCDYWEQQEDTVMVDKVSDGGLVLYTTDDGSFEADQRLVILLWIMLQSPKPAIHTLHIFLQTLEKNYDTATPEQRLSVLEDIAYQLSIVQKKLQRELEEPHPTE